MTSFNKNKCGNFSFLGLFFPRTSPGWQSKTKRSLHLKHSTENLAREVCVI